MLLVDSHAHFDLCTEEGMPLEGLFAGMREAGVERAVHVAIDADGLAWARDFGSAHAAEGVMFTAGIHPSSPAGDGELSRLEAFVRGVMESEVRDLLFGIGETGLDYYRLRRPKEEQRRSFEHQAALAKRWDLPLIVHTRDAMEDSLEVLAAVAPLRGVMHCFSGDAEAARRVLDLGMCISFAGNLTYKAATNLHEAARYVPCDRVLLETDAPFLTPVPHRGKTNSPAMVKHTYDFFARLRNGDLETIAGSVYATFTELAHKK